MYKRATCHLCNIIVFSNTHVYTRTRRHEYTHRRFILYFSSPPVERIAVRYFANSPTLLLLSSLFSPSFLFLLLFFFLQSTLHELFLKKTPLYHAEPIVEQKINCVYKYACKAKTHRLSILDDAFPLDFWAKRLALD